MGFERGIISTYSQCKLDLAQNGFTVFSLFFAPASAFNKKQSWIKATQFKSPKLELKFFF